MVDADFGRDVRLTYAELDDRSRRLAHALHRVGVRRGDRVSIMVPNSIEFFEALHACAILRKIPFYQEVSTRFEGLVEEHHTFVLLDPSGNLLEFKHYRDPRMMY